jgi:hypothetical protein
VYRENAAGSSGKPVIGLHKIAGGGSGGFRQYATVRQFIIKLVGTDINAIAIYFITKSDIQRDYRYSQLLGYFWRNIRTAISNYLYRHGLCFFRVGNYTTDSIWLAILLLWHFCRSFLFPTPSPSLQLFTSHPEHALGSSAVYPIKVPRDKPRMIRCGLGWERERRWVSAWIGKD